MANRSFQSSTVNFETRFKVGDIVSFLNLEWKVTRLRVTSEIFQNGSHSWVSLHLQIVDETTLPADLKTRMRSAGYPSEMFPLDRDEHVQLIRAADQN
jgi:hypothetical protein